MIKKKRASNLVIIRWVENHPSKSCFDCLIGLKTDCSGLRNVVIDEEMQTYEEFFGKISYERGNKINH